MRKPQVQECRFAPCNAKVTTVEKVALVMILVLATFLRLYRLSEVPPGIHDDEVINAQVADQLREGAPLSIFYEAGEGREGLYHALLVVSRALTARVPLWYRLPSVSCSLLTILLVYWLFRRRFGPWAALVTVGGLATSFWPVHLGREALRVVTFPPLATGFALAFWQGLEQRTRGKRAVSWFALAGLLLGLTQYTYLAARALPLLVVLFGAYLALFHRTQLRLHWQGLIVLLAVGTLIATPLAVYVGTHWGQQERITRLNEPLQALLSGDSRPVLSSTAETLGMFVWRGDPQPHYNLPERPVFEPLGGILFLGGVIVALVDLRHPGNTFCSLWTMAALVPGILTQPAPHFVRTAGAIVTTFVFPGLFVSWLIERLGSMARIGLIAALAVLAIANCALTYRDYFHRWPELEDVRNFRHAGLAEVARYLDHTDVATPIAVCTPFLNEQHFFWRTDRQALPYLLQRQDLHIGWYSCLEAQLFPRGGQTSLYLFGDSWTFAPFVSPEWHTQTRTVSTFGNDRLVRLEVADQLGPWLSNITRPGEPAPVFGATMALLGYEIEPADPCTGDTLEVLTAWEVLASPPYDLAILLHLLDSDGTLVGQGDALAALSDTLRPEDVFVQQHTVSLGQDVSAGQYCLATGLYVRGGERLPLESGAGDTLILEAMEVRGGGE